MTIANDQVVHARLQSMTDSKGVDITDKFIHFCDDRKLVPTTLIEFEQAKDLFVKDSDSWLP